MECDFCSSSRGAKEYTNPTNPIYGEKIVLCQVCARLRGTTMGTTERDVLHAIVLLFHALDVLPHDTDDEEES